MRYLMSVINDERKLATSEEMAATGVFNNQLEADGHWVFAGGLGWPDTATVIDSRGEDTIVSDGPYLESKEFLAGLWIIDADDLDVALKLASEASRICSRKLEVRPFL